MRFMTGRTLRTLRVMPLLVVLLGIAPGRLHAYQEFQIYVQENSGRNANCAMCHAHPDGPDGVKPGQVGSLTADEMLALGLARAAFEPGAAVANPILNAFGNHIMGKLGKRQVLQLRSRPEKLAELLGSESDLDGDGIPDSREYLEGTHPLNRHHGNPWQLFRHGLEDQLFHVLMLTFATVLGLYGLNHLLRWFTGVADEASGRAANIQRDTPRRMDA